MFELLTTISLWGKKTYLLKIIILLLIKKNSQKSKVDKYSKRNIKMIRSIALSQQIIK